MMAGIMTEMFVRVLKKVGPVVLSKDEACCAIHGRIKIDEIHGGGIRLELVEIEPFKAMDGAE